jgi:exodeoxyribonuclease V alpha subunit
MKPLQEAVTTGYRRYLETNDPGEALTRFTEFRILCALRHGSSGVVELNRQIEQLLTKTGLLRESDLWYHGRPVMVTRNDYNAKLFNGDIGIILADPGEQDEKRVFFPTSDNEVRRVLPSRLPVHETAFAMTVHKSQGSEFGKILVILPETDVPVLTRELLYTALTRAREQVEVWATESVLRTTIGRRVERASGLRDALHG